MAGSIAADFCIAALFAISLQVIVDRLPSRLQLRLADEKSLLGVNSVRSASESAGTTFGVAGNSQQIAGLPRWKD